MGDRRKLPKRVIISVPRLGPGLRRGRGKKKEQETRRMPVGLHGFSPPGRGFESRRACHGPVAQLVRAGNVRSIPRRRDFPLIFPGLRRGRKKKEQEFKAGECWWDYIPGQKAARRQRCVRAGECLAKNSSPAPEQSGECRVGLHLATMALPKGPSHVFLVAGTNHTLANAGGTTG